MKKIILVFLALVFLFSPLAALTASAQPCGAPPCDGRPCRVRPRPFPFPPRVPAPGDADTQPTAGQTLTHTVVRGDTMWKLAVRHEVGLSEIIAANPHIKDPHWIYPGDTLYIPLTDTAITDYEAEVVRLVNARRAAEGLSALSSDWQLARVARYKSQDMHDRGYFSHTSPTYGSPFDMMRAFGISYRTAGENIARGYQTPQAVVEGWMNSPGHRANILNASFTRIGVGYVSDGRYWTQMFTG